MALRVLANRIALLMMMAQHHIDDTSSPSMITFTKTLAFMNMPKIVISETGMAATSAGFMRSRSRRFFALPASERRARSGA